MIRTVADLLAGVLAAELPKLDASEVVHAPTIGDMYEGLSGQLLEKALPQGLGLQVVTGFVRGHDGKLSGQIDRMLVVGEGERVPQTDSYIWPIRDVLAVFEIKKTLTKSALSEALEHLDEVRAIERAYRSSDEGLLTWDDEAPARKAFAEMTGRVVPPVSESDSLSQFDRLLLSALIVEATCIIRVVIGWHGFKKEKTLRQHLADHVEANMTAPARLPQLVISGDFSLAKANGQPFSPEARDDRWPFYGSTAINPLVLLLEFIWTRLDVRFGLGNIWGEDLTIETLRALLVAEATEADGNIGWKTNIYSNTATANLKAAPNEEAWSPAEFTLEPFMLLQRLCAGHEVRGDDAALREWLTTQGRTWEDVVDELVGSRLVATTTEGSLELITKRCQCVIMPTGTYLAGDNVTGRFDRWLTRRLQSVTEDE